MNFTYEYVWDYFRSFDCELFEKEYINARIRMKYRCSCGEISYVRFDSFKRGNRCNKCGYKKRGDKQRYTQEKVEADFRAGRCELLGKYTKSSVKMPYRCECGNIAEINYNNFMKGKRCQKCLSAKRSGENNYQWRKDREQLKLDLSFRQRCYKILAYMIKKGVIENKEARTKSYLGYDWVELKEHIESFPEWSAPKDKEWHLDHIFPIQAFLDYGIKDVKLINALENLRPTTPEENISKNDNYDKKEFETYLRKGGNNAKRSRV